MSGSKILKKSPPEGKGGVQICFDFKSYFVCELKPHVKFQNPRTVGQPPLREK